MSSLIRTGDTEPIEVYALSALTNLPLTGATDLFVRVRRKSDGLLFDWSDLTFKSSGWTTLDQLLTEVDATNSPGVYAVSGGFDTSTITNIVADDCYVVTAVQSPGATALLPSPEGFRVGQWVDQLVEMWRRLNLDAANDVVHTDATDAVDGSIVVGSPPLISVTLDKSGNTVTTTRTV